MRYHRHICQVTEDAKDRQKRLDGDETGLTVFVCPTKGRCVKSLTWFKKDDIVVEYKGELISVSEAKKREEQYDKNASLGSFMFYFECAGKKCW